ncbi:Allophanate hydrolase subunit 2 [Providencia rettgeri]|uniref:Allophanate hydrolase subunit 2 n=1 Tax=Providencia rettgeri TaxID=587 RepID=A0A379FQ63_PRORE|nr:Allophanate hydrolase subunit 2 [Providencia rettgeri]
MWYWDLERIGLQKQAVEQLTNQLWQVTASSNRIGLRLLSDKPLEREQLQELPSEGTCIGAIQVPANGQPVLFLNDHPLTGGYPVIGAVCEYHLDLAGQIPVNAKIRFNPLGEFKAL